MSPPSPVAGKSVVVADVVCMFVSTMATLSIASFVGAIFLPLVVVGGGGYVARKYILGGTQSLGAGWLRQKEKELEEGLHKKTIDGGYVMVVREGSVQDSDYMVADALVAAQTLAKAFQSAFADSGDAIRVDTVDTFVRFCWLEYVHDGGDKVSAIRDLKDAIKAAIVVPGEVYPLIGPGKLQLTVGCSIYTIASRVADNSYRLDVNDATQQMLPLCVREFPLHGRMPVVLAVEPGRLAPLKHYYGERVAYYFEFVYFYNSVMIWPTLAGVIVHVYSCFVGDQNLLVPLYATFMMFWATLLTEFWKRTQAELAFDWQVKQEDISEDRPQFRGTAQKDKVTGKRIYVDNGTAFGLPLYIWRSTLSYTVTLLMLAISASGVLWTLTIDEWRDYLPETARSSVVMLPEMIAEQVPGVLQVVWLTVIGEVYTTIAEKLNDFENHKTEAQYRDNLIIKRFGFEFVQWLFGLFYTAFWIQDREELSALLFGAMVTRQIVRHARETLFPVMQSWRQQRMKATGSQEDATGGSTVPGVSTASEEHSTDASMLHAVIKREYTLDEYSEFNDFLDMALQFAHLTMFSSAMPLAALCAWANNVFEMRTDIYKLSAKCQRPFPHGAAGIGSWLLTFEAISVAAVVTNIALIGWTTPWFEETMERVFGLKEPLKPHHKLIVLVAIEHIVLCVKGLVVAVVPDVPERVAIGRRRQQMLAEEAQHRQQMKAVSGFTHSLQLSRRRRTATVAGIETQRRH